MWMDLGHAARSRTLQKNDRTMRTSRELRGLRKQASVDERNGEICIRFPLDNDAAVNAVIANGQALHADVEVEALAHETNERGMPLRRIDQQLMARAVAAGFGRGFVMSCGIDGTGHAQLRPLPVIQGNVALAPSIQL